MTLSTQADNSLAKAEVERQLRIELASGECLLWSGMPRQGMLLRGSDAFAIPFSLVWGGFAIFWESSVWVRGAPLLFILWGIPFVVIGLYIIFGRFMVDSLIRSRTYYGVTDQHILIVSGFRSRHVTSLSLPGTTEISLSERSDGTGTVTFGSNLSAFGFTPFGSTWPFGSRRSAPVFDSIPSARAVYQLIRAAQQEQR
jgi:hypothetical protein